MSAQRPSARASSAPAGSAARLEASGLRLGDRIVALRSGALHYFRIPRTHWRRALESVRGLGFEMVETYVPWGEHEIGEGAFDFGRHDPRKDLGAFLDLAHELGLYVFLRPGPNVNAELPNFGLPGRVVHDARNQARSPHGGPLLVPAPPRMFPAPSYASRNFRQEVTRWYRAVAEVAVPRCWPRGPIALLQADNEIAYYFRDAPYDADYHPDALADFARFLERRYATIERLNLVYQTDHAAFDAVPAPKALTAAGDSPHGLRAQLDWVAFQEALLCDALAWMAEQLKTAGLDGLPIVHNLPMGEGGLPAALAPVGRCVDLVGLDYYHGQRSLETARRRTLRLVGSSRHAFAPELGAGAPPWFGARTEQDGLFSALCACAYGLRGFNLYMAVDRDRWYGAPIGADGEPRATARPWQKLLLALQSVEFHRLRRRAEVALSIPKEYAQLSRATHALGPLSPSLLDLLGLPAGAACLFDRFGFEQAIQQAWYPLLGRLDEALRDEQIPFTYVESDAELAAMAGLRLLFAPSFEFADPERWRRLQAFSAGGSRVVVGPQRPTLDLEFQPHEFAPLPNAVALVARDRADAESLVRGLAAELGLERPITISPRPLQATLHEDERGPRVVFAVNPGPSALRAELRLPSPLGLRDALSDERFEAESSLAIDMDARSCRMLVVEVPA